MSETKRYYWLKLKNDFFEDDTIKWLEEQENGKDYVIFYLKLALKSLTDNGALIRYVGEKLIPYDVKALAKLTDTPVDTVAVAMKTFEEIGLISVSGIGEIYLNQINELIGSETDSAVRKRKQRTREIENEQTQKLVECDIVTEMSQKGHTDIRDKSLEIELELEKELEIKKELKIKKEYISPLGDMENVLLTEKEYEKLKTNFPNHYQDYIDRLSRYVASSGKKYKSHYATILNWIDRDKKKGEFKESVSRRQISEVF